MSAARPPEGAQPAWACVLALACAAGPAGSEGTSNSGGSTLSTAARLDFTVNMGKFIFFRVGPGAYPATSAVVGTVSFSLTPSIPAVPTTPATGNNVPVPWSGGLPTYAVAASNNVLPVEVRSNAGQVSIRATVVSSLVSGANTIPFSEITLATSNANLPAPAIPNAGTGAPALVAGTSFANRVTNRNADWTFSYTPVTAPVAGIYSGQVSFTASSP